MTEFKEVKLIVNETEVDINPFVSAVIGNVVNGVVSSLRLTEEPEKIEIQIVK